MRELRELRAAITRLTQIVSSALGGPKIQPDTRGYIMASATGATSEYERKARVHASIVDRMLPSKRATAEAESPTAPSAPQEK